MSGRWGARFARPGLLVQKKSVCITLCFRTSGTLFEKKKKLWPYPLPPPPGPPIYKKKNFAILCGPQEHFSRKNKFLNHLLHYCVLGPQKHFLKQKINTSPPPTLCIPLWFRTSGQKHRITKSKGLQGSLAHFLKTVLVFSSSGHLGF